MSKRYDVLFSSLETYLNGFAENGWDKRASEKLLGLLDEAYDTPFGSLFDTFGCGNFEKLAVLLGAFVSSNAFHGKLLSSFGVTDPSCITPAAVSGLFFGCSDIMPFYESLYCKTTLWARFRSIRYLIFTLWTFN